MAKTKAQIEKRKRETEKRKKVEKASRSSWCGVWRSLKSCRIG